MKELSRRTHRDNYSRDKIYAFGLDFRLWTRQALRYGSRELNLFVHEEHLIGSNLSVKILSLEMYS